MILRSHEKKEKNDDDVFLLLGDNHEINRPQKAYQARYDNLSWVLYFVLGFHKRSRYAPFIMSPRKQTRKPDFLKTRDVAEIIGISQRTLLRKLANGAFPEPSRDPSNNYRRWRPEDVQAVRQVHERETA